jgi:small subunit ribosomal protein S2
MVDTNSDPDGIDFPIPANDDAMRSIKLFAKRIADVYLEGQEMRKTSQEKEKAEEKTSPSKTAEKPVAPGDKEKSKIVVPA